MGRFRGLIGLAGKHEYVDSQHDDQESGETDKGSCFWPTEFSFNSLDQPKFETGWTADVGCVHHKQAQ